MNVQKYEKNTILFLFVSFFFYFKSSQVMDFPGSPVVKNRIPTEPVLRNKRNYCNEQPDWRVTPPPHHNPPRNASCWLGA